ncbi:hypothetical protein JOF46_003031 [Paeniglutamicibacter psychrophenolicus]|uniref:Uncharacterized protein n=1 Tax=Paeniglutamicibacter psychrophenolicus TaxID=257454 RepID=A0ABS4WFZ0_9MICC|nr:hypothetical protein [Paeniglutamicibacter psychrophenolicus]
MFAILPPGSFAIIGTLADILPGPGKAVEGCDVGD